MSKGEKATWLTSMNFAIILISIALAYLLVMAVQSCRRRRTVVDMDDDGYFMVRGDEVPHARILRDSLTSEISYADSSALRKSDNSLIEYNKSIRGPTPRGLRPIHLNLPSSPANLTTGPAQGPQLLLNTDDYCSAQDNELPHLTSEMGPTSHAYRSLS